jgi:hypothetical protein
MNKLELCQRLRQEVGGAGSGPTSTVSQTGESGRLVRYIETADEDIQRARQNWDFMRASFTVQTTANVAAYSATDCGINAFRDWVRNRFKSYLTSGTVAGEILLYELDYDHWYEVYNRGTPITGSPIHFTVLANRSFSLSPIPNGIFTITGEYQKSVTTLSGDSSTPVYPPEYHMLAVYGAMMSYGRFTGATEVYQDGANRYEQMMQQMEATQLPGIRLAGPMI